MLWTALVLLTILAAWVGGTVVFKVDERAVQEQVYYSGYDLMMRLVNDSRKLNGRPKMCMSAKLMESAQRHSNYQASILRMTHDDPVPLFSRFTNVGFNAQGVAENVAMMSSFTVEGVMRLWIGSPGHFANIIGDYSFFGSGVAKGEDSRYYWTQHFARPMRTAVEQCLGDGGSGTRPVPTPVQAPALQPPASIVTVTVAMPQAVNGSGSPSSPNLPPWFWPWKQGVFPPRKPPQPRVHLSGQQQYVNDE